MKRLASFLRSMEKNTTTYSKMYEGALVIYDPNKPTLPPYNDNEPIYYYNDIGYEITHTHKLAQDKPTVSVIIPISKLRINVTNLASATFCYNRLREYIDHLNETLYNRSRPDIENGKFIMAPQTNIIRINNYSYFEDRIGKWYENATGHNVWILPQALAPQMETMLICKIQVQLPNKKLKKAIQMLCKDLPWAVDQFIYEFDMKQLHCALDLYEKQIQIRAWLKNSNYCAFVANGSVLPRSDKIESPMKNAFPFFSTSNDEIEVFGIRGMGIKKGVTVITGGGYSGKSTLLEAIAAGIYDHILGDGRELCITDESAVSISAEDGRSVQHINISPFFKWLPQGSADDFSTEHASGSTSQAVNILEAIDAGSRLLLIDEDLSATNFMIRDNLMRKLIQEDPIIPFSDRVKELYESHNISSILVVGGSGEYISTANKVFLMQDYRIHDITDTSKKISDSYYTTKPYPVLADWKQHRHLYADGFSSYPKGCTSEKLEVLDTRFIVIGDELIDVRRLHNIVEKGQFDSFGYMLRFLEIHNTEKIISINERIDDLYKSISKEGLDMIYSSFFTTTNRFLVLPRKIELKAIINRMRRVTIIKITQ